MRRAVWLAGSLLLGAGSQAQDGASGGQGRAPDPENGGRVFQHWCAPCHATGPKHPGTQALDALYRGAKPGALEARSDLTPEIVRLYVRQGVNVMPFFRLTEISEKELEDLAAYLSKD